MADADKASPETYTLYTTLTFPRSNTELLPAYSISLHSRLCFTSSTCGSQLRSCARLFKSTGLSPLSHAWPYIYKSRAEYPWAVMVDTQLNCYVLIIRLWTARHGLLYQRVPTTKRPHGGGRRKHRPVIIKHQAHHGTNSSLRPTYLIHE